MAKTRVGNISALYYKKVAGHLPLIQDASQRVGNIFYVDSGDGTDSTSYGTHPDMPFATIDYAIGRCTASQGDVIFVLPGHAETLSAAGAIAADIVGVTIIGLGEGADKPTLTFSNTAASILITAASFRMLGFRITPSVDSVTNPFHIQAAECELEFEVYETDDAVEFVRAILTTAAGDRLKARIRYMGRTGGNACVNAVRLVGCNGADIEVDFYGLASTAIVEFVTTACSDIKVRGRLYNSGTTDGSKNVVDTITGSTWDADIFDAAAGNHYSGGSGSALAADDVSLILAQLSGAAGIATFPAGVAAANAVSIAEVLRYLQENVIVGTGTVMPANSSLYGVLAGATGVPTFPAAAAPGNGVALAEVIRAIYDRQLGDGTDASTNSLLGKRVEKATADLFSGLAIPIFTVSGGRVLVRAIVLEVTTIIQAQITNFKLQANPTIGTTTDLCANLDINADEVGALYTIAGPAATALQRGESGAVPGMSVNGVVVAIGQIEAISSVDSTGSASCQLWYIPLDNGATVAAA